MLTRMAVLSLLTSAALVAVPPVVGVAWSAGETCQGQPATIVGAGPTVTGTPGADVIVSAGASLVDAGEGNDLVCVTPGANERIVVYGRGGDDSIVVEEGVAQDLRVELGAGADRYVGGDTIDVVSSTGGPADQATEFGPDSVSTGAGDDVFIAHAPVGAVDLGEGRDRIDLYRGDSGQPVRTGPGDDEIALRIPAPANRAFAPTATIDAGSGRDRLDVAYPSVVDLRRQTLRVRQDLVSPLLGIQDVRLQGTYSTFVGDGLPNRVQLNTCGSKVKGGRGDDSVGLLTEEIDGGLPFGCFAPDITNRWFGNQGADRLIGSSGFDELFGGPGDDVIKTMESPGAITSSVAAGGGGDDRIFGGPQKDRIFGGNGDDILRGNKQNDQLFGGAGRDKTVGGPGRDTCVAEARPTCER